MEERQLELAVNLLEQSVDLVYQNDKYLIDHSIHEQNLSHRIAYYWENLLKSYDWFIQNGYNIDVEYNRSLNDAKRLDCNSGSSICKPDIILHKRGTQESNILVVEIKKQNNDISHDCEKLKAFTATESEYKYQIGIHIVLNQEQTQVKYIYFQNGQEVSEIDF